MFEHLIANDNIQLKAHNFRQNNSSMRFIEMVFSQVIINYELSVMKSDHLFWLFAECVRAVFLLFRTERSSCPGKTISRALELAHSARHVLLVKSTWVIGTALLRPRCRACTLPIRHSYLVISRRYSLPEHLAVRECLYI